MSLSQEEKSLEHQRQLHRLVQRERGEREGGGGGGVGECKSVRARACV